MLQKICKPMGKSRDARNKPTHLQPTKILDKIAKNMIGKSTVFSINGTRKMRCLSLKE